ncbi:unnamed protein product [Allacma fusca]|uniref:Uncharacterized protein n=1 Tax=Allacma fusca TaxID=39272 RepID=A0A8J2KEA1_9HEXA|nr:unnamed protein product [Allacma fusca]
MDRFPLLQEIDVKIPKTFWTHLEKDFDPHDGVEFVRVFVQDAMSTEENALDIKMPLLLSCLSMKFPNIRNFSLTCLQRYSRFCINIFRDICYFFPYLKKLRFNGSVDFPMISGTHMNVIHDCLEAGWSIQNIPRRTGSIVDLTELETLHFGSDAHITDDMIKYCLSLMPNLNVLVFHGNPHVSVQVVEDYLGHLKKIQIY